jgi:hypothetical protein
MKINNDIDGEGRRKVTLIILKVISKLFKIPSENQ